MKLILGITIGFIINGLLWEHEIVKQGAGYWENSFPVPTVKFYKRSDIRGREWPDCDRHGVNWFAEDKK